MQGVGGRAEQGEGTPAAASAWCGEGSRTVPLPAPGHRSSRSAVGRGGGAVELGAAVLGISGAGPERLAIIQGLEVGATIA
jgi:hypothetical protein